MAYAVYKLEFKTGVHFGNGILSRSESTVAADNLFSALYIEAMKAGCADELYNYVENDELIFSDAFPYIADRFYVPKPMVYIEPQDKGDSTLKKAFKKMKYIPIDYIDDFMKGCIDPKVCGIDELGCEGDQVQVAVSREGKDGEPYSIGTFYFGKDSGLYIIVSYTSDTVRSLFEDLMEALSYTGIGGKKSSGKGKFVLKIAKHTEALFEAMNRKTGRYMLLSSALPKDDEIDRVIDNASYMLQRRSGFVYSETYAEEQLKKDDLYTFRSGSCFCSPFNGDIYDVSGHKGSHPVYRYAKALFMEV